MTISFDFDKTWNRDYAIWTHVAEMLRSSGHTVIMATNRFETPCNVDEIRRLTPSWMPVYFCGKSLKDDTLRARGITVDVWIDDSPETIREVRILRHLTGLPMFDDKPTA